MLNPPTSPRKVRETLRATSTLARKPITASTQLVVVSIDVLTPLAAISPGTVTRPSFTSRGSITELIGTMTPPTVSLAGGIVSASLLRKYQSLAPARRSRWNLRGSFVEPIGSESARQPSGTKGCCEQRFADAVDTPKPPRPLHRLAPCARGTRLVLPVSIRPHPRSLPPEWSPESHRGRRARMRRWRFSCAMPREASVVYRSFRNRETLPARDSPQAGRFLKS
jgi:hypothetical protein